MRFSITAMLAIATGEDDDGNGAAGVDGKGKPRSKVWKLSKRTIAPGEVVSIHRQVSFRPVTTRKYYPGEHAVAPQINGKLYERVTFNLE